MIKSFSNHWISFGIKNSWKKNQHKLHGFRPPHPKPASQKKLILLDSQGKKESNWPFFDGFTLQLQISPVLNAAFFCVLLLNVGFYLTNRLFYWILVLSHQLLFCWIWVLFHQLFIFLILDFILLAIILLDLDFIPQTVISLDLNFIPPTVIFVGIGFYFIPPIY